MEWIGRSVADQWMNGSTTRSPSGPTMTHRMSGQWPGSETEAGKKRNKSKIIKPPKRLAHTDTRRHRHENKNEVTTTSKTKEREREEEPRQFGLFERKRNQNEMTFLWSKQPENRGFFFPLTPTSSDNVPSDESRTTNCNPIKSKRRTDLPKRRARWVSFYRTEREGEGWNQKKERERNIKTPTRQSTFTHAGRVRTLTQKKWKPKKKKNEKKTKRKGTPVRPVPWPLHKAAAAAAAEEFVNRNSRDTKTKKKKQRKRKYKPGKCDLEMEDLETVPR